MSTYSRWLFEAPVAHERAYSSNPSTQQAYYGHPELGTEFEWELQEGTHYSSAFGEEEWEGIGEFETVSRPVGAHPEVNTLLPRSGSGYISYSLKERQFGLPETIRALQVIGAAWQQARSQGPPMNIGDISFQGGGPMPPHKAHQRGIEVDIRPVRNDGRIEATSFQDPTYSQNLTQQLVNIIRGNRILPVRNIFFNGPNIKGVRRLVGHDNHLHVSFFPPGVAPTPGSVAPISPPCYPNVTPTPPSAGVSTLPPPTTGGLPGFSSAEEKALRITSSFETGKPLGFGGLTGDFDSMGISFGLMQWNFGTGSLQPLLLEFAQRHSQRFNTIFGSDASRFLQVLQRSRQEQMRFARSINDSRKRIVEPWASRFGQLANDPLFQRIQLRHVRRSMNFAVNHARQLGLRSERGLALMFDNVTQNGAAWLQRRNRAARIQQRRTAFQQRMRRTPTEREFLEIIANVIADTVNPRWSADVRRRRMTVVQGRGRVHGRNHDLGREFGLTDQPF